MLQAYWYITKMRILTTLAYRFEVFAAIGTHFILMIASIFLWRAAYGGIDQVSEFKLEDLITYSVISIMLSSIFVHDVQNIIYSKIREGQIVTDFYRPISLLGSYLADDIGSMLSAVVNKALPLFLFAAIFFDAPLPSSTLDFLLFIPSCILSYSILWLMSALVGLIAFWVMELGNMGIVKDSIVVILSGSMVPLWFFPDSVQTVSRFLPLLNDFIDTPVRQLSLGQRMRGDLAAAMLHSPSVLFRDEPTIGLDADAKHAILNLIKEMNRTRGVTVILTTHDLDDVEQISSRLIVVNHGKIIEDGPIESLIHKLAPFRHLVVDLRQPSGDLSHPAAEIIKQEGLRIWYQFRKNRIAAAELISDLSRKLLILDLSVKEPDIEAAIREI